ncbi:hypothetical protein [Bacillus sp. 165]|uniref:hypothetical protein n=1 Tax=Bacillus sp. 165 TaxID=1529117 RepID=UPI001ADA2711|nr:hypothetical protein [Bacillus sp. 165]MBO9131490.1 hypothetical protein [Bacillus sp. 165]
MSLNVRLAANELVPILKNMDAVSVLFKSDFKIVIDKVNEMLSMPDIYSIEESIE